MLSPPDASSGCINVFWCSTGTCAADCPPILNVAGADVMWDDLQRHELVADDGSLRQDGDGGWLRSIDFGSIGCVRYGDVLVDVFGDLPLSLPHGLNVVEKSEGIPEWSQSGVGSIE